MKLELDAVCPCLELNEWILLTKNNAHFYSVWVSTMLPSTLAIKVKGQNQICPLLFAFWTTRKLGSCECIATWGRPTPRQSFSALITTSCQVWSRWTYPLPYFSLFAADTLLHALTLTFDLEHLQRIACDVMKLCTKFECNRAIPGGVIAISVFDLMTLNMCYVLRSALG